MHCQHEHRPFGVGAIELVHPDPGDVARIHVALPARIEQRSIDAQCLVGSDNGNYGCAPEADVAQRALAGLEVTSNPSEVCLYAADGTKLDCFGSQAEAAPRFPVRAPMLAADR